jgi:membrane-associated protease RseP (regulator of RpoE activity)
MQSEPEILTSGPPLPPAAAAVESRPQRWVVHLALFVATFVSAMWFQSIDWSIARTWQEAVTGPWLHPEQLREGFTFAVTLLSILLAHEMGHYLTARRHRVDQTLPYFIPFPTLFGTLGAVILMRSMPQNRRVLMRVAAAGPFAGLLLALPAAAWGLAHSLPTEAIPNPGEPVFGSSILWTWLCRLFAPSSGAFINLHPVATAAWAGLLVTSINLIPAAQLDGGHIAYALFGQRQLSLSRFVVVLLLVMGLFMHDEPAGFMWLIWAVLLTLVGLRHPPVRDEYTAVSKSERAVGYLALVLFLLTFVPRPILREPSFSSEGSRSFELQEPTAPSPASGSGEEYRL